MSWTLSGTFLLEGCVVARSSGSVRQRCRVRFQSVKVPLYVGFPVENPTNKATASKLLRFGGVPSIVVGVV